jgi:predicted esterase
LVSGFVPRDLELVGSLNYSGQILHIIGQRDLLVNPDLSLDLVEIFKRQNQNPLNSKILMHDGGHLVPQSAAHKAAILNFVVGAIGE